MTPEQIRELEIRAKKYEEAAEYNSDSVITAAFKRAAEEIRLRLRNEKGEL